jgi:hypothetical protein
LPEFFLLNEQEVNRKTMMEDNNDLRSCKAKTSMNKESAYESI